MSRLGKILFVMAGIMLASFAAVQMILGWVPFCWVTLGFFAGLSAAGFWFDRVFFREFFGMKTTRQGMSMGWMIVLVLGLLTAVNFIGVRRYLTWDFSMNKVNTLSDQSIKLLKDLKEDLRVVYFYQDQAKGVEDAKRLFIDLLKKYQDQTPRVKLEFVEVNQNPALAEKYNIKKGTQSVILEYMGRTNLIEKIDEQEVTSALIKVSLDKDKTVYVIGGHGELPIDQSQDGISIANMKQSMLGNRYLVKDLNLSEKPIPPDADAVLIFGPTQQFLDLDIKAVETYLRAGGSVFIALEPECHMALIPF